MRHESCHPADRAAAALRSARPDVSRPGAPTSQDGPRLPSGTWLAHHPDRDWHARPADPRPTQFHRRLAEYASTPLIELPVLAVELGVGRVFAKDETHRLGLPAFKGLGASWAVHRAVEESGEGPLTIVTATDGNHGRAVARFAREFAQRAEVFVPRGVHPDAIAAIRAEGAGIVEIDGTYDEAVASAADRGEDLACLLVQDTAWAGYEEIPGWIVDGYDTLFVEIDEQLDAAGVGSGPDVVVVPTGVGSLLQAAVAHYRRPWARRAAVVSVEPHDAACVYASLAAGAPVSVATGESTMAGLNCGTVSSLAWPTIVAGLAAAVLTDDAAAARAAVDLVGLGVDAGPCGAAPLAALRDVVTGPNVDAFRHHVGVLPDATVVLLVTEGSAANPRRTSA